MDSCFVLIGTLQHGIANLNNASANPAQINCTMTRSPHQVPYFEITCSRITRGHITRLGEQGARRPKVSKWCLAKQNVDVQNQSKHFNARFNLPMSTFRKSAVFAVHTNSFSNFPVWEAFSKGSVFDVWKHRYSVDVRPNRTNKGFVFKFIRISVDRALV